MRIYKRFFTLGGVLLFPFLIWLGFNDSNYPISFISRAYSAGSGDHQHASEADVDKAAVTDDQHAAEADEHKPVDIDDQHAAEAEEHKKAVTDDQHAAETEEHKPAVTDDQHAAETEEHKPAVTDDHHAAETEEHKPAVTEDHHAAETEEHKPAVTDDQHAAETDDHKPAVTDDHHAAEADDHKPAVTDDHHAAEADDQHAPGTREQAHGGPILLPMKRTTLLSRTQMRGYTPYQYYCAACHGKRGIGDGVNAKNLAISPRRHNDASYMANLTDAYLNRVIKEGGVSQGFSPLMPPWGGVLSDEEISNLIAFLRILPEARMVASAEEYQKSAGMGGHHNGGAQAEGHHATDPDDHHAAEADEQKTPDTDHHAAEADDHQAAGTEDH